VQREVDVGQEEAFAAAEGEVAEGNHGARILPVIPAEAGTQADDVASAWIPAFAGMTHATYLSTSSRISSSPISVRITVRLPEASSACLKFWFITFFMMGSIFFSMSSSAAMFG